MTNEWIEIPARLGSGLWMALRAEMRSGGCIVVHESFSDPAGACARPTMMTVVALRYGGPVLRLETTWDHGEPIGETGDFGRKNEVTRYWLPHVRGGE